MSKKANSKQSILDRFLVFATQVFLDNPDIVNLVALKSNNDDPFGAGRARQTAIDAIGKILKLHKDERQEKLICTYLRSVFCAPIYRSEKCMHFLKLLEYSRIDKKENWVLLFEELEKLLPDFGVRQAIIWLEGKTGSLDAKLIFENAIENVIMPRYQLETWLYVLIARDLSEKKIELTFPAAHPDDRKDCIYYLKHLVQVVETNRNKEEKFDNPENVSAVGEVEPGEYIRMKEGKMIILEELAGHLSSETKMNIKKFNKGIED